MEKRSLAVIVLVSSCVADMYGADCRSIDERQSSSDELIPSKRSRGAASCPSGSVVRGEGSRDEEYTQQTRELEAQIDDLVKINGNLSVRLQMYAAVEAAMGGADFGSCLTAVEKVASHVHMILPTSADGDALSDEQLKIVSLTELFFKSREYYARQLKEEKECYSKQLHDVKAAYSKLECENMKLEQQIRDSVLLQLKEGGDCHLKQLHDVKAAYSKLECEKMKLEHQTRYAVSLLISRFQQNNIMWSEAYARLQDQNKELRKIIRDGLPKENQPAAVLRKGTVLLPKLLLPIAGSPLNK